MSGPAELCAGHDWLRCDLAHVDDPGGRAASLQLQRIAVRLNRLIPEHNPRVRASVTARILAEEAGVGQNQVHNLRYGKAWLRVNTLAKICDAAGIRYP